MEVTGEVTLCLGGDVMTGRGIDQALPHPADPALYEEYAASALDYVALAEAANGPIKRPVDPAYVWGDALAQLERHGASVRIVNLETSITTREDYWPKGINYRMSPANIGCLTAARLDCCALANNHVLDWGRDGLAETLDTLARAGIATAGAGRTRAEAETPAILDLGPKGRVLVFAFGHGSSGIPPAWAATDDRSGIDLLDDLTPATLRRIANRVAATRQSGDLVVASIHWGPNWGYDIPESQIRFAHSLIDEAGIDLVHGHSSHHAKAIEIYRDRPILYGCGDLLNDYEGISGYEAFRDDLSLLYLAQFRGADGGLTGLELLPFQIRKFRLNAASDTDARWLRETLGRECARFGVDVALTEKGSLSLSW